MRWHKVVAGVRSTVVDGKTYRAIQSERTKQWSVYTEGQLLGTAQTLTGAADIILLKKGN